VLALVHDENKAATIKRILEGPVTFMCPASLLQKSSNAVLYLNEPAASQLSPR
jgi:glucosamine-6-phosphate deaminase